MGEESKSKRGETHKIIDVPFTADPPFQYCSGIFQLQRKRVLIGPTHRFL